MLLFQRKFPFLFPKDKSLQCKELNTESYKNVVDYTFFKNKIEEIIFFEKMPESEAALISTKFSFYSLLKNGSAVYVYSCLENGVKSAALLSTLLPRLAFENISDYIKVYCYYNYLDQQEELNIQGSLCEKTQCRIPVVCFGNDLINCTTTEIENKDRDKLAKYFAYFYKELYDGKYYRKEYDTNEDKKVVNTLIFNEVIGNFRNWSDSRIDKNWLNEPEIHKDSNRQAADHASIKLAIMDKFVNVEKANFKDFWTTENVKQLAEIEHIRWNSEKLLMGWIPIDDELKWKKNKNLYKQQKMHHWLKKFDDLTDFEKDKDRTQILGLPYFLSKIQK
jgi:hypothetical protein